MKSNRLKRSKTSRHFRNLYLLCGTNSNRLRIKNKCSIVEREEEKKTHELMTSLRSDVTTNSAQLGLLTSNERWQTFGRKKNQH